MAASTLKDEGNKLFKEGKYAGACEKYTEALKQDPRNSVIYSNRSVTHIKLKNYEHALSDAQECIKLNPQWSKGYYRKTVALEGLARYDEVMQSACEGFRRSGEGQVKRELADKWLKANQKLNCLPEGSIDLPSGILILSKDYLNILVHLIRSINGECPLSLELTEQCLYSCAEQMEKILTDFGEPVSPVIKEWASRLPHEVYPYSVNPVAKPELEQQMKARSDSFIHYIDKDIDPALYPILRPVLGLVALVVLNRTNILSECNTGHHSAELMNRALLPLFETSILSTDSYRSMHIGRLCAVLDSFIGRGYKLSAQETTAVQTCCVQLEKAVRSYPKSLPEYRKDKELAERALSNVRNNVLLPASSLPPTVPLASTMSIELAEQLVKESPLDVQVYLEKHLKELESVKFLTMGEVEELITMTGIFYELNMKDVALKVFRKGERAFFQVLGHMLSSNTLMLDQCHATLAPMRQRVLCEASTLKEHELFADVVLRWKCLFKEFRSQLIQENSGEVFGEFFQWHMMCKMSQKSASDDGTTQAALLMQMQKEETLLRTSAKPILTGMAETSYKDLQKRLVDGALIIDYIFFVPLRENPLLDGYCVIIKKDGSPIVCELNYKAIRNQAAVVARNLLSQSASVTQEKINSELSLLARVLFPRGLLDILASGKVSKLYISPDSDIAHIPFDSLPVNLSGSNIEIRLFEKFSISILSSTRKLLSSNVETDSDKPDRDNVKQQMCTIIGNPNFDLCMQVAAAADSSSTIDKLINFICGYFSISPDQGGPTVEKLEHSKDEVDSITSHLQSQGLIVQSMTGDDATLRKVLSLESPLLIHVSTHAHSLTTGRSVQAYRGSFFDDLKSAAIILTGFNTYSTKQIDRLPSDCGPALLPPLAIFSLRLKGTKLVFLSACSSAAGKAPIQEAVDSLAEAFLTAGAETVIAALWPIGDKSAADISKLFYKKVTVPGTRPSDALTHAKKTMEERNFTSYWSNCAAFVCYGIDKPLFT